MGRPGITMGPCVLDHGHTSGRAIVKSRRTLSQQASASSDLMEGLNKQPRDRDDDKIRISIIIVSRR